MNKAFQISHRKILIFEFKIFFCIFLASLKNVNVMNPILILKNI